MFSLKKFGIASFSHLLGTTTLLMFLSLVGTSAFAQFAGPVPLALVNGWTGAPFSTSLPTVEEVAGIVQFRGSIAGGTTGTAFTLPVGLRPATSVYIPVDLCNATNGRLIIQSTGVVIVQAETSFSNAQCFTSLDGASFAPTTSGFTALTLINGWNNAPFGTSNVEVKKISGIVHFKGAMATGGTNSVPFILPPAYRPKTEVYVPVDLCNATNGRLHITTAGVVDVEVETSFSNAQCFTSLDGAWFSTAGGTLHPINGWFGAPFSTNLPKAANAYGVIHFMGAIATGGTNSLAFSLPIALRPVTDVYIPVDLCNATKGRMLVRSNGDVFVQAEGNFANAQCFTSLDGASFVQ